MSARLKVLRRGALVFMLGVVLMTTTTLLGWPLWLNVIAGLVCGPLTTLALVWSI